MSEPRRPAPSRAAALGGIVGPSAFVAAWVAGAAVTARSYSSVDDPISRLAAVGADTRWLMTAGFVVFGVALPLYAASLRRAVPGPAWIAAAATGLATLGVAATPLDRSDAVDAAHGLLAGVGYLALAATPLLAARPLLDRGHRGLALLGVAAGVVSTISLGITTLDVPTGLFQRAGLTATDLWIVATAGTITSGRLGSMGSEGPAAQLPHNTDQPRRRRADGVPWKRPSWQRADSRRRPRRLGRQRSSRP
jgi:hypothetical protein